MQPLINLKQFVAVLVLLIVPAALLTAYFRNFQPDSGAQPGDGASGHHAAAGRSSAGSGTMGHQEQQGSGEMDHSSNRGKATVPAAQPALGTEQLEASRAQLEASRLQLEASRMALEGASRPAKFQEEAPTAEAKPPPATNTAAAGDEGHKH